MRVRIGVVGAYRGKSMIDVLMAYNEDAEIVAICDFFEPALNNVRSQAQQLGLNSIAYYTDFDTFLKHDMDAVCLANYATEHAALAISCLNAGKHVLSEVMPCETMAQAVELVEAVERSGKVYAYAENYCYMDVTYEMWRRYKEGTLGEVRYAEGEYIHDTSICTPQITYGDKNHWRNRLYPTYYSSHSLGPILTITGKRPVQVIGYTTPPCMDPYERAGCICQAGIEMVTLENGAIVKSIHGGLKRETDMDNFNYQVYCEKGMMESGRLPENAVFNLYQEGEKLCVGHWEKYMPEKDIRPDMARKFPSHHGGDFYATYFFIQKILGRPEGEWSVDVYTALDMGICGILAWRSALNGNQPIKVPNLRNPEEREAYRNDHACTTPAVAGGQLIPQNIYDLPPVPDETYDKIRDLWQKGLDANGDRDTLYSAILDVTAEL